MSIATVPTVRPRSRSLNDVRSVIPDACYRRSTARAAVALLAASLLYLLPVAALALTDRWWALVVLWVLAGLGIAGLFVLGHDASHGALVDSRRANRAIAQICMGPSLHVEAAWDLGHNRIHHGYTTRQGFDFVWHPTTVDEYRALRPLARLRHRLEWSCVGSGLYYLRVVWWQKMWRFNAPGKRHDAIVRDKLTLGSAVIVVVASSMVIGALTGGWTARCGCRRSCSSCRSWCSCRSSDGPSTCTTSTRPSAGGLDASGRSSTARWSRPPLCDAHPAERAVVPQHLRPRAAPRRRPHPLSSTVAGGRPHRRLVPRHGKTSRGSIGHYLRATRTCKLYDFETGRWLPYAAAHR